MSDAEREFAIREGERIGAWDAYSRARMGLGMIVHEASFCDGFDRGYLVRTREVTALQAEIESLRKDAERLDWVQRNLLSADFEYEYQPGKTRPVLIIAWPRDVAIGGNARMNFDAAIAKEKQQ